MFSLIRTIRRSIARLSAAPVAKPTTAKPVRASRRTNGGREADTYRAARRAEMIRAAKEARRAARQSEVA